MPQNRDLRDVQRERLHPILAARMKEFARFGDTLFRVREGRLPSRYNLGAMKYWYWTVICATPTCSKRHFAKFIGEGRGGVKFLPEGDLPVTFFHECQNCGKVHTYTPADLLLYSIDPPRLNGLREWW